MIFVPGLSFGLLGGYPGFNTQKTHLLLLGNLSGIIYSSISTIKDFLTFNSLSFQLENRQFFPKNITKDT